MSKNVTVTVTLNVPDNDDPATVAREFAADLRDAINIFGNEGWGEAVWTPDGFRRSRLFNVREIA